jgi:adenylate cyclase
MAPLSSIAMNSRLLLRVYADRAVVHSGEFEGVVELGRQQDGEDGPYARRAEAGATRLVIAPLEEQAVSRRHVRLEALAGGKVRVTNLSSKLSVGIEGSKDVLPRASVDVPLPAILLVGRKVLRVQLPAAEHLQALSQATLSPGRLPVGPVPLTVGLPAQPGVETEALLRWLQAALTVIHEAAGTRDFFPRAARALVEIVGLDAGRVLHREGDGWVIDGAWPSDSDLFSPQRRLSETVLGRVCSEKKTFWCDPAVEPSASLIDVSAVVAAPVLNRDGEVIGALYGERRRSKSAEEGPRITRVEALLVDLLAGGVAAGLARLKHEEEALRARERFEQFFTPELSRHLAEHPDLLEARDAIVTVLFCDVRSFSRITERLGPAQTVAWMSDVLEALSSCVQAEQGVLVNYVGDALLALWGAPGEQPDHAERACRAALAMQAALPALDERWRAVTGEPIAVGVGINTGPACVGNIGSRYKFKYGPQGNTVNLASRVQGATKYLKTQILLTTATASLLPPGFATRRLGRVRTVNIREAVELCDLVSVEDQDRQALRAGYEKALTEFEAGRFRSAAGTLGLLVRHYPDDGPSLVLLSRAVACLVEEPAAFDGVWELPGK